MDPPRVSPKVERMAILAPLAVAPSRDGGMGALLTTAVLLAEGLL